MVTLWLMRRRVAWLVLRAGVPARDAEDVVQEVMLGAWRSLQDGRYSPHEDTPAALWAWVRAITRHQIGNARRRAHRRHERMRLPEELEDLAPAPGDLEARVGAAERLELVLRLEAALCA